MDTRNILTKIDQIHAESVTEGAGAKKVIIKGLKNWIKAAKEQGYSVEGPFNPGGLYQAYSQSGSHRGTFSSKAEPGPGSLWGNSKPGMSANSGTLFVKNLSESEHDGVTEGAGAKFVKQGVAEEKTKTLKDWFNQINEAEQVTIQPATQKTQVIKQGTKTLGTVENPALASTIKAAIGKGEMSLVGDQLKEEPGDGGEYVIHKGKHEPGRVSSLGGQKLHGVTVKDVYTDKKEAQAHADAINKGRGYKPGDEKNPLYGGVLYQVSPRRGQVGEVITKKTSAGEIISDFEKSKDPKFKGKSKEERKKMALGAYYSMHPEKSKSKKKTNEAERPSDDSDMGAGLGAGRNPNVLESNEKVNESMNHRKTAAYHEGRAHGLKGHAHNGKHYEDMEEARQYHEGYKSGLDECYGMGVYEQAPPPATVPGMASQAMEGDMDEGNAFTAALAKTPKGGKFTVGGKTFTDRSNYNATVDEMAFESLDRQLNALLNESEQVAEGMSVSINTGMQGAPNSVSVNASDADADKLLDFVKKAGLGVFGGESGSSDYGAPVNAAGGAEVDEHDSIMSLIKKMSHGGGDYEVEKDEGCCSQCGQSPCGCEVNEVETPDQELYQVAEDETEEQETTADENAEAEEDKALALKSVQEGGDGGEASEEPEMTEEKEEHINEWANEAGKIGTDEAFEADINFITKMISGGLNKPKSTGQTTIPVIAGQKTRMGPEATCGDADPLADWISLSGIKK